MVTTNMLIPTVLSVPGLIPPVRDVLSQDVSE